MYAICLFYDQIAMGSMNPIMYEGPVWAEWNDYSSDDDSSDDDHEYMNKERRVYKMQERINLDKWDDFDFVYRFRVSKETFCAILLRIKHKLDFDMPRPRYILPDVQLLIALRFFALGSMEVSVADFAGVCTSSVCRHLRKVSEAIAEEAVHVIKMPETIEELGKACKGVYYFDSSSFARHSFLITLPFLML